MTTRSRRVPEPFTEIEFHNLRLRCVQLCEALERRTQTLRPQEAISARILAELISRHRFER